MPVAGTETLGQLRTSLTEMLGKADDFHQKNLKGELSPDQIAEMKDLGDEIVSFKTAIETFPKVDDFRQRVDDTKRFMRTPATNAPPTSGKSAGGDGASLRGASGATHYDPNPFFGIHSGGSLKSLGEMLVEELRAQQESGDRAAWQKGHRQQVWGAKFDGLDRLDGLAYHDGIGPAQPFKTTLSSTTAPLTSYQRPPGIVAVGTQRLTVADLLAQGTPTDKYVRYVKEDSYTNAADTVAEAAQKPEASFAFSEVDAKVEKIAVRTKITEEMWEDFQQLRSFVDERLRFMVMQSEEDQLLNGNGTSPDIRGIIATVGVQTESGTSDADNIEAVHRAITKVRAVGFFEPDGIVVHPTDYQYFRLSTDLNGQYYGGGPFTGPYGQNGVTSQPALWGMRTVITTAITAGTVLVGAFQLGAQIFRRQGVIVEATNSNSTDFEYNLLTLRAEERLALAVYRPKAFTVVTLNPWG